MAVEVREHLVKQNLLLRILDDKRSFIKQRLQEIKYLLRRCVREKIRLKYRLECVIYRLTQIPAGTRENEPRILFKECRERLLDPDNGIIIVEHTEQILDTLINEALASRLEAVKS